MWQNTREKGRIEYDLTIETNKQLYTELNIAEWTVT